MHKERMLAYLPNYYRGIKEVDALLEANGANIVELRRVKDDVTDQLFVDTATWGLTTWERLVGLPEGNDLSTIGVRARRAAIKSKLQGASVFTMAKVREVCALYASGAVEITMDGPTHTLTIEFVDVLGIPTNLETMQRVLEEQIPAHIRLVFEFRYMTWNDLDAFNRTWDAQDALNLDWENFSAARN